MSDERLTAIGIALRADYQAWLAQALIVWPEQFRQTGDDWEVLRRVNAEFAEMLRPIRDLIELDAWLTSGFFALPMPSFNPEPGSEAILPEAFPPSNPAILPGNISLPPVEMGANVEYSGYAKKTEENSPSRTVPSQAFAGASPAAGGLRDLARLAQNTPIVDEPGPETEAPAPSDKPSARETPSEDRRNPAAAGIPARATSADLLEKPSVATEKLPAESFSPAEIPFRAAPEKTAQELPIHFLEDAPEPGVSQASVTRQRTAQEPSPNFFADLPKADLGQVSITPDSAQALPENFFADLDLPEADFGQHENDKFAGADGISTPHPVQPDAIPASLRSKAAIPGSESRDFPANAMPLPEAPSSGQDSTASLTPADLQGLSRALGLAYEPAQPGGAGKTAESHTVPASLRENPLPAGVDFAEAWQPPVNFQRLLMALPFGNNAGRLDLPLGNQPAGQAARRNGTTATGRHGLEPQGETEPVVERRVRTAQNAAPSSLDSEIDVHDLLDSLSQEIWREYQRYYGR